jgi:hypothetical protein
MAARFHFRLLGKIPDAPTLSPLHDFALINFLNENPFQSLSFGEIHRLHMLGVLQHFPRQASILTIALQFGDSLSVSGHAPIAFRRLVVDVHE